jgi:hypothetical protein
MTFSRLLRHLFATRLGTRRRFPDSVDADIETAIRAAEARMGAEIRFVIETALDWPELRAGLTPRERAAQVFAEYRVWDTELRNGVLIYVLVADRDVEIVADRAAAAAVPPAGWEHAAKTMEDHFRAGRFREGSVAGIEAVARLLEPAFPARAVNRNELPNQPSLL